MSAYDKIADLDRRVRAGGMSLVDVLDHIRTHQLGRYDGYSRDQLVAATAVNDAPPAEALEPEKPTPEPIRSRRNSRRT